MNQDDWEEQILKQMVEMFKKMGLDVDESDLSRMMDQIQSQFESMGVDPEKIRSGDVKINLQSDFGNLGEMFGKGGMPDLNNLLENLGVDVRMGSNPESEPIEIQVEDEEESEISKVPVADMFVQGNSMNITIDISRHDELSLEDLELNLTGGGSTLQLMRTTQPRPLQIFELPKAAESVDGWELNNGILDITLKLQDTESLAQDGGK
tara:strand:+ start:193 stop:816 length:624 start_codon:yes stop_codon:yes gene_type:complete